MKTQLVGSSTWLALLILAVASTGCLIIPIPTPENEVTWGRKLKTEEIAGWRLGETKRAEVLQQLGAPFAEFPALNVIAYEWVVVTGYVAWFVGGGYSANCGVDQLRQEHLLLVGFDAAERVTKFEIVHHNLGRLQDQATQWAVSMPAPGHRIAASGKRTAKSDHTALLYVYRPGGGWLDTMSTLLLRILLDGKLAAELDGHSFACISVPPGSHTVTGWIPADFPDANGSVAFTASTNETRYLEATVISAGKTTVRLRLVAPESDRKALRKMKDVGVPLPGSL